MHFSVFALIVTLVHLWIIFVFQRCYTLNMSSAAVQFVDMLRIFFTMESNTVELVCRIYYTWNQGYVVWFYTDGI